VPLGVSGASIPQHPNAQLGLIGSDHGDGITVADALDHACFNALGFLP
jgi:hypothetical protein